MQLVVQRVVQLDDVTVRSRSRGHSWVQLTVESLPSGYLLWRVTVCRQANQLGI